SRRRHTRSKRDWSSDVCSSDLLIETRAYARADREKGRFRSFLLGTLKHFIADVRDRGRALKRGGGMILQNLDDKATAEAEVQIEIGRASCRERVEKTEVEVGST